MLDPKKKLRRLPIPPKAVRSTVLGSSALPQLSSHEDTFIAPVHNPLTKRNGPFLPVIRKARRYSATIPPYIRTEMAEYRITLHIVENWGHPSLITTSQIDIIGPNHIPLKIDSITPRFSKYNSDLLPRLVNNEFNKDSIDEAWTEKWTPGHPIVLTFALHSEIPPDALRIWNGIFEPSAGIKKIQVYCGPFFILEAEIPQQFGRIITLSNDHFPKFPKYDPSIHGLDDSAFCVHDKFGRIPIKQTRIITLECFESFGYSDINPNLVGINGAEFYDVNGQKIDCSSISQIFIGEGNAITNISAFYQYHQPKIQENEMLLGLKSLNGVFRISFVLKVPMQLGMIRIYNYDGDTYGPLIGMKKVKVYCDGNQVFMGPLKKGKSQRSWTDIWFMDAAVIYSILEKLKKSSGSSSLISISSPKESEMSNPDQEELMTTPPKTPEKILSGIPSTPSLPQFF